MRELILEINDSHGRSISTLKPTVENSGKTNFSVKNNTDKFLLAVESRDLSEADKIIIRASSFPKLSDG